MKFIRNYSRTCIHSLNCVARVLISHFDFDGKSEVSNHFWWCPSKSAFAHGLVESMKKIIQYLFDCILPPQYQGRQKYHVFYVALSISYFYEIIFIAFCTYTDRYHNSRNNHFNVIKKTNESTISSFGFSIQT